LFSFQISKVILNALKLLMTLISVLSKWGENCYFKAREATENIKYVMQILEGWGGKNCPVLA
jgi:hypothetical protein